MERASHIDSKRVEEALLAIEVLQLEIAKK